MKRTSKIFTALFGATLLFASAQTAIAAEQPTNPILGVESSSLAKFGGREGVHNWVESLFYYIMLDNRINHIFKEFGNVERQVFLNTQLETMVLGGPNEYQGASMSAAHAAGASALPRTTTRSAISWPLGKIELSSTAAVHAQ